MAKNLKVGDTVYIPWARLNLELDANAQPSAIARAEIVGQENRTIQLRIRGLPDPVTIATSAVHDNAGIAVIRIGDYSTETTLLDPLAKSVLQYCRLLVNDDSLRMMELRTETELTEFWGKNHGAYRHVVLIGHGGPDGLTFGTNIVPADRLGSIFSQRGQTKKIFISLCCKTGVAGFGKVFSRSTGCESIIAPFQSIHGAIASQFCQTLLAYHLLEGRTTKVAFTKAQKLVPGGATFRLWQKGEIQ
ncbi:MAG: hypothetical protein C0504_06235 [Candidatus Solibacter sp.]|nr:hypothetical protein [Candidatus Solibacter sp.]